MLTQGRLQAMMRYDRINGEFTWLYRPEIPKWINARVVGKQAGYIGDDKLKAAEAYRDAAATIHGNWTADMPELARLSEARQP